MTRTERERHGATGDRPLDLARLDPDFADYYDDAPPGAPAVLRAPTPLAGVPAVRRNPPPTAQPPVRAGAAGRPVPDLGPAPAPAPPVRRRHRRVDSPFLGLFPGAGRPARPPQRTTGAAAADPPAAGPGPAPPRRAVAAPAARPAAAPASPYGAAAATDADGRAPVKAANRPAYKDRDPVAELAITEIAGHLTFTPTTVTAWYWLPEVRWAFRPDADREALHRRHLGAVRRPGRLPAAPAAHLPAVRGGRVGPRASTSNTARPLPDVPARRAGGTIWSAPSGTCCR